MVVNIYDTANELERQMRQTQEFIGLKEAFDDLTVSYTHLTLPTKA